MFQCVRGRWEPEKTYLSVGPMHKGLHVIMCPHGSRGDCMSVCCVHVSGETWHQVSVCVMCVGPTCQVLGVGLSVWVNLNDGEERR